jgi:hypothetical protein
MIPKSGDRFPAFAKPAPAGEGRSDKIMLKGSMIPKSGDRFSDKIMLKKNQAAALSRSWRGNGKNMPDSSAPDTVSTFSV